MNHQEFYNALTKTDISLHTLFSENLFSDYKSLNDYLDKTITDEYAFSPEEEMESKGQKKVIPSKVQLRFGASYLMISIFGKYDKDVLEKCIKHVREVEWDSLHFLKRQIEI